MNKVRKILSLVAAIGGLAGSNGAGLAQDAAAGEKLFKRCAACHTVEAGKNKIGPSLFGVIGRTAGTAAGYKYSALNLASGKNGLVWNEDRIFGYLADPTAFLVGFLKDAGKADLAKGRTKMSFRLAKERQRRDVIAYIASKNK